MTHRVNFILDDSVWQALKQVDKGDRSRVVNRALTEWLRKHKRRDAVRKMDELRAVLPTVSMGDIVAWVREEQAHVQ